MLPATRPNLPSAVASEDKDERTVPNPLVFAFAKKIVLNGAVTQLLKCASSARPLSGYSVRPKGIAHGLHTPEGR